jgi:hypothetical protein
VVTNVEVPTWRRDWIAVIVDSGKTVRSPAVPSVKLGAAGDDARICVRIFCEIAAMLCVVKRLAAATWLGLTPAKIEAASASPSWARYRLAAASGG